MPSPRKAKPATKRLRVGDQVIFKIGGRKISGTIIEDRGRIGVRGRRLYAIRIKLGPSEESIIEIPAEELTQKQPAA